MNMDAASMMRHELEPDDAALVLATQHTAVECYFVLRALHWGGWVRLATIYQRASSVGRQGAAQIVRELAKQGCIRYREQSSCYQITERGEALRATLERALLPALGATELGLVPSFQRNKKPAAPPREGSVCEVTVRTEIAITIPVRDVAAWVVGNHPKLREQAGELATAIRTGRASATMSISSGGSVSFKIVRKDVRGEDEQTE